MTDTTLPFADLERVYEHLATTLDELPEGEESHFLAQLALALAHRVPEVDRVMAAIEEAKEGATIDPPGGL
ncbi:hypothetical protein IOC61_10780 [Halomonas sp. KAO]|uniref:hypothetical protein n=1 Tax=unclassified Halomonas TaxID=2609666 RepID=UPI00189DC773|nr:MULTISPECIES: hypothetical protein [unclassified Halomonas]MBF7053811.1 hypothetical protein [Halomonas sp. KAO]MDT0502522.1 hypothetical protein [Halomonas sp. PAR7]MDT0512754.1 hypothetical protein [Halomonas sp. LES1]MDT0591928.1 hypothetical protein [Halomonas sp. PAR8]